MDTLQALPVGMIVWVVLAVTIAGLVQGALGFGFPFIATPMAAMLVDMRTAVIAVLLPTLASVGITLFTSGPLRPTLQRFWLMPVYATIGALAGTLIFVAAPDAPYQLLLAVIIVLYLNIDRLTRGEWPLIKRNEKAFAPVAGLAAGLFEGTANVAAPPLIIYYLALGLAPAMLVQAMQICFFVGKSTQFLVLTARGGVTAGEWIATLPLCVIALGAGFAGARLRGRIDAGLFRRIVKTALALIAAGLLTQYLYRWLHA